MQQEVFNQILAIICVVGGVVTIAGIIHDHIKYRKLLNK